MVGARAHHAVCKGAVCEACLINLSTYSLGPHIILYRTALLNHHRQNERRSFLSVYDRCHLLLVPVPVVTIPTDQHAISVSVSIHPTHAHLQNTQATRYCPTAIVRQIFTWVISHDATHCPRCLCTARWETARFNIDFVFNWMKPVAFYSILKTWPSLSKVSQYREWILHWRPTPDFSRGLRKVLDLCLALYL